MTNYGIGHFAEKVAADYLKRLGYKIRELNWSTKYCEIDIIAEKAKCIYFIEVKYRERASWGTGLEYITPKKLKQMAFAAELWVNNNDWSGDYQLAAVELSGQPPEVTEFLTEL
jgi:putative endonuclease